MANNDNIEFPPNLNTCLSTNFKGSVGRYIADGREKNYSYQSKGEEYERTIFISKMFYICICEKLLISFWTLYLKNCFQVDIFVLTE